jgi:hypothetical protein
VTHLRIVLKVTHDLSLNDGQGMPRSLTDTGVGSQEEPPRAKLSEIITLLTELLGMGLSKSDQLYFDQIQEEIIPDSALAAQAKPNTLDNFALGLDRIFARKVVDRRHAIEDLFRRRAEIDEFRQMAMDSLRPAVHAALNEEPRAQ